jgi:hypothetical protein
MEAKRRQILGSAAVDFWPISLNSFGGRLLGRGENERLEACVEAALVTGDGVLVQNTLLNALIESGDSGAELGLGSFRLAGGEGLAHLAKAIAHARTVGAVDLSLGDGLAGALQRRDMICHGVF